MRFKNICIFLLFFCWALSAIAQPSGQAKQPRILILLDGSSSMLQPWEKGQDRYKAASKIITTLIDSVYKVNDLVEFALRVYGHQSSVLDSNCFDTRLEVMFSKDNLTQISLRLDALHPYGITPIAFSVGEAAEKDMIDVERNEYSLILITDGGESCGGNLCDVVKNLLAKKINFKPYILSLVDYAPLRQEYNCLGNYLQVTTEKDIKVAVGTIVDNYKPMLTLKPSARKTIETVAANPPSVLKVNVSPVKIKVNEEPPAEKIEPKPQPKPVAQTPPPVKQPEIKQPPPAKDLTDRTNEKVALKKDKIARMQIATPFKFFSQRYATPSFKKVTVAVYRPPAILPDPIPAAKPPVKPVQTATNNAIPSQTDVKREESKETTVEIYFWDGKGKFYKTSPQVILTDPNTKQVVNKFWRTVDPSGNPDPKKDIPEGVYELTVTKSKIFVPKLEVKAGQRNIFRIEAGKASLRFEYEDDMNQPVKEYIAQVKKNFEAGPIIDQFCYQELEYEPGNYHIIINTLPISHRTVDLEFGAVITIRIEKPGAVRFTNTTPMSKIELYYELGDQFVKFSHSLEITGNPESQALELQRGRYRVGYKKHPAAPQPTFKDFVVKSKQITAIELD